MNEPSVFAIILNWNDFDSTKKCMESLRKARYGNLHFVVVDNASTDKSEELIHQEFPDTPLLVADRNGGYAYGMNIGVRYALRHNADYVLVMNNDMLVEEDFLMHMIEPLLQDETIGTVSPKVLYMDFPDTIYCAGGQVSLLRCCGLAMHRGKRREAFGTEDREISFAEGSCILIRSEVFRAVGYFDEKFFMYFEDIEFSNRVNKKYKLSFAYRAVVYHKSGAGHTWTVHTPMYQYYYTRNRLLFFSTYPIWIRSYALIFSLFVSLVKSIVVLATRQDARKQSIGSLWRGQYDGMRLLFSRS
jgi:GT2 family glycosyltransferase